MNFKPLLFFCLLISFSCNNTTSTSASNKLKTNESNNVKLPDKNPYHTIASIPLPKGYTRTFADSNSFAGWLRNVKLKDNKTVYLFDGRPKLNQTAQFAVLDISVPDKDLQQCADAVMRLRAEYLFAAKQFDAIRFTDNDNTEYAFHPPYTQENFMGYMATVFGRCGSASLSKQLHQVADFSTVMPGDVLIRGGFPGHAVIVMDVAADTTGKKIFMLAQSYMPAQDIHLLVNPANDKISPWYEAGDAQKIITPEYVFYKTELKRW
jgi:hypothetical protein